MCDDDTFHFKHFGKVFDLTTDLKHFTEGYIRRPEPARPRGTPDSPDETGRNRWTYLPLWST